jgi:hypothetical protein
VSQANGSCYRHPLARLLVALARRFLQARTEPENNLAGMSPEFSIWLAPSIFRAKWPNSAGKGKVARVTITFRGAFVAGTALLVLVVVYFFGFGDPSTRFASTQNISFTQSTAEIGRVLPISLAKTIAISGITIERGL